MSTFLPCSPCYTTASLFSKRLSSSQAASQISSTSSAVASYQPKENRFSKEAPCRFLGSGAPGLIRLEALRTLRGVPPATVSRKTRCFHQNQLRFFKHEADARGEVRAKPQELQPICHCRVLRFCLPTLFWTGSGERLFIMTKLIRVRT
jgi:hypothetical protein